MGVHEAPITGASTKVVKEIHGASLVRPLAHFGFTS